MRTVQTILAFSLFCAVLLFSGCGGGGGGGGGGGDGTGWSTPDNVRDTLVLTTAAGVPQIAGDDDGNFMMVWRQADAGGDVNIYARLYTPGVGWEAPVAIDDTSVDSNFPQIAADGNGNFVSVWQQTDGFSNIYANRYTAGAWQGPVQLDDPAEDSQSPQIAADGGGHFMAVWQQGLDIYANRFTGGNWLGTPELVYAPAGISESPQVAADPSGAFMVVWLEDFGDVGARRYSGGWDVGSTIISSDDSYVPQVAADGSGNFIAVWEQVDPDDANSDGIFTSRFTTVGGWEEAAVRDSLPGDAYNPQIASDGVGTFVIVWDQDDGTDQSIYAAEYDSGWGNAFLVEGMAEGAWIPQVAARSADNYMIVWAHDDGTAVDHIWSRTYNADLNSLGSLSPVDDRAADNASVPQVAGGLSNFMAVWAQDDGTGESIFTSLY